MRSNVVLELHKQYRAVPKVICSAGRDRAVVRSELSRMSTLIPSTLLAILNSCAEFKHIDEHIHYVRSCGLECTYDSFRELLSRDLLISDDALRTILLQHQEGARAKITTIAIPTCGRPELDDSLESYCRSGWISKAKRLLVCDDSPQTATSERNRNRVLRVASLTGQPVEYVGIHEKKRLIKELNRLHVAPPDVLAFGLFGVPGLALHMGANRNWILLLTSGEMVLSLDDDTLCRTTVAPSSRPRDIVVERDGASVWDFWSYPNRETCFGAVVDEHMDIITEHEAFLGRPLGAVCASLSEQQCGRGTDLTAVCDHFVVSSVRQLGVITSTLNGGIGDSGMYSGLALLRHKNPDTHRRILRSADTLGQAMSSRYVIRQAPTTSIVHEGPLCSMFMGIDNRLMIPPFFPSYRNEDGILASTLNACLPDSYVAHLPFSVMHNPQGQRQYADDGWTRIRVADVVIACIAACSTAGREDAAAGLELLGSRLVALSSRPLVQFQDEVKHFLAKRANALLNENAQLLNRFASQPDFWARKVVLGGEQLKSALTTKEYFIPSDLPNVNSPEEAFTILKSLIYSYGQLLTCWPAVVKVFRSGELRSALHASEITYGQLAVT
jgi:hypothetical protein